MYFVAVVVSWAFLPYTFPGQAHSLMTSSVTCMLMSSRFSVFSRATGMSPSYPSGLVV